MRMIGLGGTPKSEPPAQEKAKKGHVEIEHLRERHNKTEDALASGVPGTAQNRSRRSTGYMLIVGLDFGTAYTKCIVRDAMVRDPGKAYPVAFNLVGGKTYLFPSVVIRSQSQLLTARDTSLGSHTEVVDFLKMRLVSEVDGERAAAWRSVDSGTSVRAIVAWFFGQVLAEVGRECRSRWSDFGEHPEDSFFVNTCVPIAYADGSRVEGALLDSLCAARVTMGAAGVNAPTIEEIESALADPERLATARDWCYTYPETSANLQSYLKSRARQPGLYLFLDVGAGTVDLTFFQLMSDGSDEAPLRYYHASVLDAGSSRLELKAVQIDSSLSPFEVLSFKEGREHRASMRLKQAFERACLEIHNEVGKGVGDGVSVTESKLHKDRDMQLRQMKRVQLMFAGGGFLHNPYELAARFFQKARKWDTQAPMHPLPEPDDIEWRRQTPPIPFSRLSVAYGLSFARYELDGHRFPGETRVNPDAPIRPPREQVVAPTKDDV